MLTLPPRVECVCLSVCLEGHSFMFLFVFSSCLVASLSDECSRRLVLSGVSDLVFDGSASALGLLGLSSRPNPMPPGPPCALPSAWNALPCLVPHGLLPILHSLLRSCPHGKAPQALRFPLCHRHPLCGALGCRIILFTTPASLGPGTLTLSTEAASPPARLLGPVFSPRRREDQSLPSGPGNTYFLFFPLSLKDKNQGELIPPVLRFTVTYLREKGESWLPPGAQGPLGAPPWGPRLLSCTPCRLGNWRGGSRTGRPTRAG